MSLEAEVGYNLAEEITLGSDAEKLNGSRRKCGLCGVYISGHLQKHSLACHLPWYFNPTSACWQCHRYVKGSLSRHVSGSEKPHSDYQFSDSHLQLWCQLMFGILVFFTNHFELSSVIDLVDFVICHKLFLEHISYEAKFDSNNIRYLQAICRSFDLAVPETFNISPPNHVVCILHWKTVVKMLGSFKHADNWSDFRLFSFPISLPFPRQINDKLLFIDTHCHLDTIMTTMHFRGFHQLKANLCGGEPDLKFCISNFVFPWRWFTMDYLLGSSPLVYGTIGVHPHAVIPGREQHQVSEVAAQLNCRKFIGVGEVGLDFQSKCKCKPVCRNSESCLQRKKQAQRLFLHGVLPLAEQHNLTLVLHCRDDGDGQAAEEVHLMLKTMELTNLHIHRHCFIGSTEEMQNWLDTFPNVMFGITAKSLDNFETKTALSKLKLEKILLETDSPYLATNPWQVHLVAKKLSTLKNVPLSVLIDVCNSNVENLYRL